MKDSLLTEVERAIKDRYEKKPANAQNIQSTMTEVHTKKNERMDEILLPDEDRPKMPLTKDKYIIRENPFLVEWERETRKFLRYLSPEHGHRVTAVMVYEWATGINVKDLYDSGGNANRDLRHINAVLAYYFGKPYTTYIAGKKVKRAYKIKPGYYIKRHRPKTIELWVEWSNGSLQF